MRSMEARYQWNTFHAPIPLIHDLKTARLQTKLNAQLPTEPRWCPGRFTLKGDLIGSQKIAQSNICV